MGTAWVAQRSRMLRAHGIPPGGQRATPWRTFVQAHWPALVAADFFTTEVWTTRGLVTYYTAFLTELQSRRLYVSWLDPVSGRSIRHAEPAVRQSASRTLSYREGGSWSAIAIRSGVGRWSSGSVQRAFVCPNAAGCAELQRACGTVCPVGEGGLPPSCRRWANGTSSDFARVHTHYHRERNHQALANELIDGPAVERRSGAVVVARESAEFSATTTGRRVNRSRDPCWDRTGLGCQRSRSNSSSDTRSCRRILKNSGGPISRPPCSGMVTDRPSLCVQRSWLPVCRRLTKPSASATR